MFAEKGLYPNVDFYAATVYHYLGIPTDLFTPVFSVSRMAGWTAHVMEQHADNRLIRPDSEYIGERGLTWIAAGRAVNAQRRRISPAGGGARPSAPPGYGESGAWRGFWSQVGPPGPARVTTPTTTWPTCPAAPA